MKPRLSRSLRRIFAGVVVCCLVAQTGYMQAATQDEILSTPSVAASGMAWRSQMERQLRNVRNRTVDMNGGVPCWPVDPKSGVTAPIPNWDMWVNADIDYTKMYAEGYLPGYKLHSAGGTFGVDGRIGEHVVLGGALSGMTTRMHTQGLATNDHSDMDSYYASIYTRVDAGCWNHTIIGTVGWADLDTHRHGFLPLDDIDRKGTPDGLGLGVMYEVARSFHMNRDFLPSAWWQPVFNVTYIHSRIDSYTERGGLNFLSVDKQNYDNVVFGLGARMQSLMNGRFFNNNCTFSCRVLGKAITGTRHGRADVVFADGMGLGVRTASQGSFGVEVGAGLSIPLGSRGGCIFVDGTGEFGKDYRSVGGALGYRISF